MEDTAQRSWDFPSALLLTSMLFVASARLVVTNWTPDLGKVEGVTLLGAILGLLLGRSRFGTRGLWILIGGYTLTLVPSRLLGIITQGGDFGERLSILMDRWANSLVLLFTGKRIEDPLFFLTVMAILYWGIAVYAGFQLARRGNALAAAGPPGLGMIIIQVYDYWGAQRLWPLGLYFFLCLLLLGRLNYLQNKADWRRRRITATPEAGFDINAGVLASAATLILVAWLAPISLSAFAPIEKGWNDLGNSFNTTRQRLNDALAAVHGTPRGIGQEFAASLELGRAAVTGDNTIFSVEPPQTGLNRYYWRARIYDTYGGNHWSNEGIAQVAFSPSQPDFSIPDSAAGSLGEFTFHVSTELWTVVTPPQPVWIGRSADATFRTAEPSGETDLISFRPNPPLHSGDTYHVRSILFNPTIAGLETAGSNYPVWITDRYLQLPQDFSGPVRELALQVTDGLETPYDKAEAVTDFLRSRITYSATVPALAPGADPIETFLFTWKAGFCDYYATAEVLMLRSLGIPARLAVGYSQGTLQGDIRAEIVTYLVRQRETHAWPEVYFPGLGWVEFEPTANLPAIVRPADSTEASRLPAQLKPPQPAIVKDPGDAAAQGSIGPYASVLAYVKKSALWIIIILIGGAAGVLVWQSRRRQRFVARMQQALTQYFELRNQPLPGWVSAWIGWTDLTPIGRAFSAINWSLRRLGNAQPANATPAERAARLARLLPAAAEPIQVLAAEFEAESFSPRPGDIRRARAAGWRIRLLTVRSILNRLF